MRINVRLVDTEAMSTMWAESFEGDMADMFKLEDELVDRIAAALSVTISPDESRRIYLRHTSSLEALDLFRQASRAIIPPNERASVEAAEALYERILEIDPAFAGAYVGLAQVHSYMVLFKHSSQPEIEVERAMKYAHRAIELDDSFGLGHSMLGLAYLLAGQRDLAVAKVRWAVEVEPGDPLSYQWLSVVLILSGRSGEAITPMLEALRLDPIYPQVPYLNLLGIAYFNLGEYADALRMFELNRQRGGPIGPHSDAFHAATHAALGQESEARTLIASMHSGSGAGPDQHVLRRFIPNEAKAQSTIETLHRLGMRTRDVDGT